LLYVALNIQFPPSEPGDIAREEILLGIQKVWLSNSTGA